MRAASSALLPHNKQKWQQFRCRCHLRLRLCCCASRTLYLCCRFATQQPSSLCNNSILNYALMQTKQPRSQRAAKICTKRGNKRHIKGKTNRYAERAAENLCKLNFRYLRLQHGGRPKQSTANKTRIHIPIEFISNCRIIFVFRFSKA